MDVVLGERNGKVSLAANWNTTPSIKRVQKDTFRQYPNPTQDCNADSDGRIRVCIAVLHFLVLSNLIKRVGALAE